jgi:hypothetical protein
MSGAHARSVFALFQNLIVPITAIILIDNNMLFSRKETRYYVYEKNMTDCACVRSFSLLFYVSIIIKIDYNT